MPPAFSAAEKQRITQLLRETGYRLFTTQGLRKTSLEDLVAPADVAKSTFYVFFDSKEALYLELMLQQTAEVTRKVIDGALLAGPDTRDGLRRFLRTTLEEITTNPLWRRLTTHPEELRAVAGKLDPARVTGMAENPVTALADFIARKQKTGEIVGDNPAVVVGVLQTVLLVPLHAERLGDPDLYPKILDLLIDIVTAGLTPQERRTE